MTVRIYFKFISIDLPILKLINIRRVAETQMVSVRKRNIQGRYNGVRHLQRRYLELPPLRVVSIVDSIVTGSIPISLENIKTTRTRLRVYIYKQDIRAKLKVINPVPALSSHNSVTVNSVGVNTKNRRKKNRKKCDTVLLMLA